MTHANKTPAHASTPELYAAAYKGEVAAAERYTDLAEDKAVRSLPEVADLFESLARAEWVHASLVAQEASQEVRNTAQQAAQGAAAVAAEHPQTPCEALKNALASERRAVAFFDHLREVTDDRKLQALAAVLRDEEIEHVRRCSSLLRRYQAPEVPDGAEDDLEPTVPSN